MKALLVGLALAALCIPAHAAGISLGKPGYGGNGCPAGTADVALGAGGKTLTLRFDSYQASAGGSSGKSLDRKTCNLAIPVKVPAGKSVSIIAIDFRGQSRLPAGASARFSAEYFLAGSSGPKFVRNITGPKTGAFTSSDKLTAKVWSACGTDVILRTNSSILVKASGGKAASFSVKAQDVKTAVVYSLQWRDC